MPSSADYKELLPVIQAISPESVVTPNMPIDVYVQEAENLYHWSLDDQAALSNAGLSLNSITDMAVRAGACREAQSLWVKERKMNQEAEKLWNTEAPAAFDMRNHLIHAFRYAFRNDAALLARIDEIAQGDSNSDMVQDLNDLSVLGKDHLDLLALINLAPIALDDAAATADRMGDLLGATNGERKEESEAMIIRDKAFTYLKQAVDDIRECGKFVFWRDPERLKGYASDYWQRKRSATAKETPKVEA